MAIGDGARMKKLMKLSWIFFLPFLFGFSSIAHRGDNELGKYSEHSFAAYDRAVANGVDYLELDVQRSKDGVLVVSHDDNMSRIFGVDQDIGKSSFASLRKSTNYSGESIHSLQEVFNRYQADPRVKFMLETKNEGSAVGMEKRLVNLIKKKHLENRILFESFSRPSLNKLSQLDPEIPRTQLTGDYHQVGNNQYYAAGVFNQKAAEYLKKRHKGYIVWGLDQNKSIRKLAFNSEVSGMMSDYSEKLAKYNSSLNQLPVHLIKAVMRIKLPMAFGINGYQTLHKNAAVKIVSVASFHHHLWYGLGNNQWIDSRAFLKNNYSQPQAKTGRIMLMHAAEIYGRPLDQDNQSRNLRDHSQWTFYAVDHVKGRTFYNLGGAQWIDGKDAKLIK